MSICLFVGFWGFGVIENPGQSAVAVTYYAHPEFQGPEDVTPASVKAESGVNRTWRWGVPIALSVSGTLGPQQPGLSFDLGIEPCRLSKEYARPTPRYPPTSEM